MRDGLGLSSLDYKRIRMQQKVNNFLNSHCTRLMYTLHFGKDIASRLHPVKRDRMRWLHECYNILQEEFADFLENYHFSQEENLSVRRYIWVCWLQGTKSMPDVVSCCIKSIQDNAPEGSEVVLITSSNLKDYVAFPDFIYERLKKGTLTVTHFSDLIRMALLRKYGGIWIDATVFVSGKIPEEYLEKELYSIQILENRERYQNPYYGGITSFLIGGSPRCMLFDFCLSFFVEYLRRYQHLLDVHSINLCYRMAYEHFPEIRQAVDAIGVNNRETQILYKSIHLPYTKERWDAATQDQIFHKLNWRIRYTEYKNGEQTVYGYIKHRGERSDHEREERERIART